MSELPIEVIRERIESGAYECVEVVEGAEIVADRVWSRLADESRDAKLAALDDVFDDVRRRILRKSLNQAIDEIIEAFNFKPNAWAGGRRCS